MESWGPSIAAAENENLYQKAGEAVQDFVLLYFEVNDHQSRNSYLK
jgi:uncharacterized protein HemX